jgi:hypothetical protein
MLLNDISLESIFKGFKKCCMSNHIVEQTTDGVMWEKDNEENLSSFIDKNVGSD